jgi:WD40 repeat protein
MNTTTLLLVGFLGLGADKPSDLKELASWEIPARSLSTMQFSPDSGTLAISGEHERGKVLLWDPRTGREKAVLVGDREHDIYSMSFSADSRRIAGASNTVIKAWEMATRKEQFSYNVERGGEAVSILAFSADGGSLVTSGFTAVYSLDLSTRTQKELFKRRVRGPYPVCSLDGKTLASPNYQDLDLWDISSGKIRRILADHRGGVVNAAFSADGKTVAAAVRRNNGKKDHWQVQLWDAENGKVLNTISCDDGFLCQIQLDNKAKSLVVLHQLNWRDPTSPTELRFFDLSSGREYITRKNLGPRGKVALSPDGKLLATLEPDNKIKVWEVPNLPTEK